MSKLPIIQSLTEVFKYNKIKRDSNLIQYSCQVAIRPAYFSNSTISSYFFNEEYQASRKAVIIIDFNVLNLIRLGLKP